MVPASTPLAPYPPPHSAPVMGHPECCTARQQLVTLWKGYLWKRYAVQRLYEQEGSASVPKAAGTTQQRSPGQGLQRACPRLGVGLTVTRPPDLSISILGVRRGPWKKLGSTSPLAIVIPHSHSLLDRPPAPLQGTLLCSGKEDWAERE